MGFPGSPNLIRAEVVISMRLTVVVKIIIAGYPLQDTNAAKRRYAHYRICGNDCNQGAGESPLILKARGRTTGPF
jgi:hypothetical protein